MTAEKPHLITEVRHATLGGNIKFYDALTPTMVNELDTDNGQVRFTWNGMIFYRRGIQKPTAVFANGYGHIEQAAAMMDAPEAFPDVTDAFGFSIGFKPGRRLGYVTFTYPYIKDGKLSEKGIGFPGESLEDQPGRIQEVLDEVFGKVSPDILYQTAVPLFFKRTREEKGTYHLYNRQTSGLFPIAGRRYATLVTS